MPGVLSSSSTRGAVRRHCQTMALYTGRPVFLSHRMVVSRWLVMPMPAMSLGSTPLWAITSFITPYWLDQISIGLCSTQP